MPPRQYLSAVQPKVIAASKPLPVAAIPSSAKLYSIREASRILLELYGEGYSESSIRDLIDSGDWVEGVHWSDRRRRDGLYRKVKIYLEAVQKWQVTRHWER